MKLLKGIPEVVKGAVLMLAGLALLFHTLGILQDLLWYALIAISLYLIFVGFIKVRGIETVTCMFRRKDQTVVHEDVDNE